MLYSIMLRPKPAYFVHLRPFSIMSRYKECRFTPQKSPEPTSTVAAQLNSRKRKQYNFLRLGLEVPENVTQHNLPLEHSNQSRAEEQKLSRVSLVGLPNAGKSTVLNRLLGVSVSAVSKKINTTTTPIEGMLTKEDTQVLITDLPGLFASPKKRHTLDQELIASAWDTVASSDVVLFIVDATLQLSPTMSHALDVISSHCLPPHIKQWRPRSVALVFNKVDLVYAYNKHSDFALREYHYVLNRNFDQVFHVAAKSCSGQIAEASDETFRKLMAYCRQQAAPHPWMYPSHLVTSQSKESLVYQHIRSYLLDHTHQEVPYVLQPRLVGWKEYRNGVTISLELIVANTAMLKSVIGRQGAQLKSMTAAVEPRIAEALWPNQGNHRRSVHLHVQVCVRKDGYASSNIPEC